MSTCSIVVGVDGSSASKAALRWALREARLMQGEITALMAWDYPTIYTWEVPSPENVNQATAEALASMVDELAAGWAVTIAQEVVPGNPARALLDTEADMVVVGSRGHGGFVNALLGSVSRSVATHSSRPVVVVQGEEATGGPVVVGVDDSQSSRTALRFAFEAASLRETELVVVQALPSAYFIPGPLPHPDREEIEQQAQLQLSEQLAGWGTAYPDVSVRKRAEHDHPVSALHRAALSAQLLVVGRRGRGGFGELLLGSVATGVLHHASCPVAVIHTVDQP